MVATDLLSEPEHGFSSRLHYFVAVAAMGAVVAVLVMKLRPRS